MEKTKSVVVNKFGGFDSLSIEEIELPALTMNIEVKVEYGGLNFADIYIRKGLMAKKKLPFVLGIECAGVISAIGENVDTNLKVGQRVICYNFNGGMYRKIVRLTSSNCFLLPDFIDCKLGAAIFVNYLTAYFSLIHLGNLRENESVLILSCTGGVGTAAVQISKTIDGVKVVGTGSITKEIGAKENGVDSFICKDTFLEDLKDHRFDVILSNESGDTFEFLQNLLKPLGRIILIGSNNSIGNDYKHSTETATDNVSLFSLLINNRVVSGLHLGILLANDPEKVKDTLNHIFNMVIKKKLCPLVDSVWDMTDIVEATKLLEERKNIGKVLLKIA